MATEQEIAERKAALLDAVGKQDWESAGHGLTWLIQNLPESQVLDFSPELLTSFDQAIGENCKESIAFIMRGSIKMNLGRKQEAITDYDEAVRLGPKDSIAYFHRATVKNELLDYQGAIIDLDYAIKLSPDDVNLYYARAIIKKSLNDHRGVIADLDEIIKIDPNDAEAYGNRGAAKGLLEKHQEAISDFDKAIQLNIDDPNIYNNLGASKRALGKYQEAIEDFDKFIGLNPNEAIGYGNRGLTKGLLGNHQEAIIDFDMAIQLNPDDFIAYRNRGAAKELLGKHQEAIIDFDMAIQRNPSDFIAYRNRGAAKESLGKHREAIEDFNAAIQYNPNDANTYHYRGSVNLEIAKINHKNNDESLKEELERVGVINDFREALRLEPSEIRFKQFESVIRFVSSLRKNIEFNKEELNERRKIYEKTIKPFLCINYGLALLTLIVPILFLLIPSCCINPDTIKQKIEIILNYFGKLPLVVYIMSGAGLFAPVFYPIMQISLIHRLEFRTHESRFPVIAPAADRKPTYGSATQSNDSLSPGDILTSTYNLWKRSTGDGS